MSLRLGWKPDWIGRCAIASDDDLPLLEQEVERALNSGDVIAVDTETTGLDELNDRLFFYSFTYFAEDGADDARVIPVGRSESRLVRSVGVFVGNRHKAAPNPARVDEDRALAALSEICERPHIMFNAKYDCKMIWHEGINTDALLRDVYLSMYVIDSGFGDSIKEVLLARKEGRMSEGQPLRRNLKELCEVLLGWNPDEKDELHTWLKHKFGHRSKWLYHHVPMALLATYGCGDTERTLGLHTWAEKQLAEREQSELAEMESDLTQLVAEMENNGFPILESDAIEVRGEWLTKGDAAMDKMLELTGLSQLEYGSEDHLVDFAWPALNDQVDSRMPIPSSWSADGLEAYVKKARGRGISAVADMGIHGEFCAALLEKRLADKVVGTYLDPWLNVHGLRTETGRLRVHAKLKQEGAGTGRFSSEEPNLQNVPPEARSAGTDEESGRSLVYIDYSQLEYRVFAHYAGGHVLAAYRDDPTTDFHQVVADMLGIPRKPAKNINFGMLYGMGRDKLIRSMAQLNDMKELEAVKIYNMYQQKFPKAKQLAKAMENRCKQRGYIKNLFGRRRYLGKDFAHKSLNTICQGGAADIVKRAMVRLWQVERDVPEEWGMQILLQIHDELNFEVNAGYEADLARWAVPIMEDEAKLNCPLIAEAEWSGPGVPWREKENLSWK